MIHRSNTLIGISISLALIALVPLVIGYLGYGRWALGNNLWPMHHGYYGHGGMVGCGTVGITLLLFWGLLIIAGVLTIVWLVGNSKNHDSQKTSVRPDSHEILK